MKKMKVKDLIKKLKEYNPEAETSVIVHNREEQFSMIYGGGGEGETENNCKRVGFCVDRLCQSEEECSGRNEGGKMFRERRVRLWDKENKKMVYYETDCSAPDMTLNGVLISHDDQSNVSARYELMQFTGLHDKNGKEIYEGDILKAFDKNYEVKFITTGSKVFVDYGYPDKHNGPCDSWAEVIGNIFQNKDLLEEKP